MQIRDLVRASGVPAKTIRYYESIGLLPPAQRAANNYRRYQPTDVDRLRFIANARSLGIRLGDIAEILAARDQGIAPCDRVLGVLAKRTGSRIRVWPLVLSGAQVETRGHMLELSVPTERAGVDDMRSNTWIRLVHGWSRVRHRYGRSH